MGLLWFFLLFLPAGGADAETTVIVAADVLNVRTMPWGEKIGCVYQGQQFLIEEKKDRWGRVEYGIGQHGWIALDYTREYAPPSTIVSNTAYCGQVNTAFDELGWPEIRCRPEDWKTAGSSELGRPLVYDEFGAGSSVTLLVCSIHSDESTAYQCFRLHDLLKDNPGLLLNRLVIVPLLNPDGFLRKPKTRTNARGVDLNRNLPTSDWAQSAMQAWLHRYGGDERRNPGPEANSEPENRFLLDLIAHFRPDKIISIHSPLNFLDLDYLDSSVNNPNLTQVSKNATELAKNISTASDFRFYNYNTFPGSLGRYGSEWRIPIYTLELPDAEPSQSIHFFDRFKDSLVYSFNVILDDSKTAMNQIKPSRIN
jgi:protein MpaA